jgi:hypothetical protein
MIHCIGDSHSAVFSGKEEMQPIWPIPSNDISPYFRSYRIGAATAYQLANKIPIIDSIINSRVNKDVDKVLFCFGEVDIRAHLKKQMEVKNEPITSIVRECVDRYFDVIQHYKNMGIDMLVWGPIASWHDSKKYTGGPSFGTNIERNNITKEFNDYLKELCSKNNIGFVSIFYDMVNSNNETIPTFLDDWDGSHIHLSQRSMPLIIKRFEEQNLL